MISNLNIKYSILHILKYSSKDIEHNHNNNCYCNLLQIYRIVCFEILINRFYIYFYL